MLPCVSFIVPVPTGWACQPLPGDHGPRGLGTAPPLSCSSEEAVASCRRCSLSFLIIPCWLLSSSIAPWATLCNVPSVTQSQSGSSSPLSGSYRILTEISGREDSEKWIRDSVGRPRTANPGPGSEGRQGLMGNGKDTGWWPFPEAIHLAAEAPECIL